MVSLTWPIHSVGSIRVFCQDFCRVKRERNKKGINRSKREDVRVSSVVS